MGGRWTGLELSISGFFIGIWRHWKWEHCEKICAGRPWPWVVIEFSFWASLWFQWEHFLFFYLPCFCKPQPGQLSKVLSSVPIIWKYIIHGSNWWWQSSNYNYFSYISCLRAAGTYACRSPMIQAIINYWWSRVTVRIWDRIYWNCIQTY